MWAWLGFSSLSPAMAQWVRQRTEPVYSLEDVYFTDVDTGYAVGVIGTALKTTDGGTTWTVLEPGISASLRKVQFVGADTGFAVGNAGTFIKTTNGGASWTSLPLANEGSAVDGVYFKTGQEGFVIQGDKILRTTDGGEQWETVYTYDGAILYYGFRQLKFVSPHTAYAIGGFSSSYGNTGEVCKSEDGGLTWRRVSGAQPMGDLIASAFPDALTGYLTDLSRTLYKTTDGAETWEVVPTAGLPLFYNLHFVSPDTGYGVGTEAFIQYTTDGGKTWNRQDAGGEGDFFTSIYFPSPTVGYAVGTLNNSDQGTILKYTTDVTSSPDWQPLEVQLFPNPSRGTVRLQFEEPLRATVTLHDGTGRLVRHVTLRRAATLTWDLNDLSAGIYVLTVHAADHRPYSHKVVLE